MNINEKFFRVEKLTFLAPLTRLLGQRELRTRCCPERPQMTFKHFTNFDRSHDGFATILNLGPIWALLGPTWVPEKAP